MMDFNKFKLDRINPDSFKVIKELKLFLDEFVNHKEFNHLTIFLSDKLGLNPSILNLKIKKYLLTKFNYKSNKFNSFSSPLNIISDLIIFLLLYFRISFFGKKSKEIRSEVLLTNVDFYDEVEKFKNVLSKASSSTILFNKNIYFKNTKKNIKDEYLKENLIVNYKNSELTFSYKDKKVISKFKTNIKEINKIPMIKAPIKNKSVILKFALRFFIISFKNKFNFLRILNLIFQSYIKNYSIFSNYKSKFLLQDRLYNTCPIRNFLFKKSGGLKTYCLQTHLVEGSINMFNDIDVLLTFGSEKYSLEYLTEFGSRVEKIEPVGSLRGESFIKDKKNTFSYKNKIDILIIGVNLFNWLYVNEAQKKNYYNFIKFIRELSLAYKNLNISIKHHPNNVPDAMEKEILNGSNVKFLDPSLNTYRFIENTKYFLSFSSTMILEVYGFGKKGFFIDVDQNNYIFFKKNEVLKKISVSNLDDLKQKLNSENNLQKDKNYNDNFCLNNNNVSNLIFKSFNTN